ncbi:aminotransferase class III-fold pyridoxal phosphate-dependent enzyme [Aliikangiella coralliicola]|uniref:Aminotransferase class III-fold pyridoxal phosphate-dependent enzyme n=1 Tax=Aliikangiella coralliicola TaxID=2592383 RepID=A0A545UJS6_9GAMM|nr:aminotransferase class III-fold pyridoxal phosphate-dependent enzyme [Aliikangiella coralliicola]TQV89710.1 aminotransferase class III-fold pyridoxal phosphate-dependent enzyme [Aliikangiella coralliicola]
MTSISVTPQLSHGQLLNILNEQYGLVGELSDLPSYIDLNRKLTTADGKQLVVKIANIHQSADDLAFENLVINRLSQESSIELQVPSLISAKSGDDLIEIKDEQNQSCLMRVIAFLDGKIWAETDTSQLSFVESLGESLAQIDKTLATIEHPAAHRYLKWDIRHSNIIVRKYKSYIQNEVLDNTEENQTGGTKINLINQALQSYEAQVLPLYEELPSQIIYNDANDYNLLVNEEKQQVCGLFDFGDMVSSFRIAEIAIASAYAIMNKTNAEEIIGAMVQAYHQVNPLKPVEIKVLLPMIKMRLAVSLSLSSYQYSQSPENDYLLISQQGAWKALSQLDQIDAISFELKLMWLTELNSKQELEQPQDIIDYRKKHLSENLSLAYDEPLKIVAGRGAYLYNEKGTRYLDMVNNVCHVGHCHPGVVAAGQRQMSTLNTNTRYLHDNIVRFAEKLLSTMPKELSVCMFVNSGSEANELALRLARKYTNRKAMVVVEGAYHGNANACIDISPYKFDGPGGDGAPDWIKQTLVPDPYRGKYRGRNEETGLQYGKDVKRAIEALAQEDQPLCAFICESIQGVGGQVIHPPGYLKSAYAHVRDAGGVCIADEVQVGMGRVGTHWWAFQTQDVVPDIVTIGKPLGNGHPLAAVVTTQEIADSFVTGMEYFNTFGGNPVSCAIGCAVIDAVEQGGLMAHALQLGEYLQQGLRQLQSKFPVIGDVRGLGMFIGAEFVKDRDTLEPAVEQIDYVIERLKSEGILLTTEGPFHNVLKIKPPLAFSKQDADFFLSSLEMILTEQGAQP